MKKVEIWDICGGKNSTFFVQDEFVCVQCGLVYEELINVDE